MKLSHAIDEFKDWRGFKVTGHTVVRYDRPLRTFCLCLADPDVENIHPRQALYYLQSMEKLGWKRNGIVVTALAFRKFFEYCELRGYKSVKPELIPLPRKEFNIPRVANEKDFEKLIKAIPKDNNPNNIRNLALLSLIWDSWARSGEVLSVDIDELVFDKDLSGHVLIKTEKSRGRRPIREIFWTAKTGKYLKAWIRTKRQLELQKSFDESEALFVSIRKCGYADSRGKRMTNRGVCEVFRTISNRAGLKSTFNAHSARHFGGREIIKQGGSNADVSNILGHSHHDSSMIYTMMWGEDLHERYRKFKPEKNKK